MSSLNRFSRLLSSFFLPSSQSTPLVPEPVSGKTHALQEDMSRASKRDRDAAHLARNDRSALVEPPASSITPQSLDSARISTEPATSPRPTHVKFGSLRRLKGLSHPTRILHLPHPRRHSSDSSEDENSSNEKAVGSGSLPMGIPTIVVTEAPTSDSEEDDKEKPHVTAAEHASLKRSSVIFDPSSEPVGNSSRLSIRTTRASTRASARSGRTRRTRRSIATSRRNMQSNRLQAPDVGIPRPRTDPEDDASSSSSSSVSSFSLTSRPRLLQRLFHRTSQPGPTSLEHTRFSPSQLTALSRARANRRFGARLMHHDHDYLHRSRHADRDSDEDDDNGFLSESSLFSFSNADTRTLSRDSLSEYEHGLLNTLCFCLCWSPRPRTYEYEP